MSMHREDLPRSDIGVVTCCWAGDEHLVKATCASVRYFCPDMPLCVIVDGELCVNDWIGAYNATPLYVRDLECAKLRDSMLHSMFAKHAALFAGPFERFIYLDSDALFWGDPFNEVDLSTHDFTIFGGCGVVPRPMIDKWQFSLKQMETFDPKFQMLDYPYFSAGVYGSRRGCIPQERFLELSQLSRERAGLFKFGDQGVLNYLVFSEAEQGRLSFQCCDLQFFPGHFPKAVMDERFVKSWFAIPAVEQPESLVLHFSGKKPDLALCGGNHKCTFTLFRFMHYRFAGFPSWAAFVRIMWEDFQTALRKVRQRLVRSLGL